MKHVLHSEPGSGVDGADPRARQMETEAEPAVSWETRVAAIDERVHYVGPVLEEILHLDHDTWPGSLRE